MTHAMTARFPAAPTAASAARERSGVPAWAAPAVVFLCAAALRVTGLGWPGTFDEFYHLLAAQGYLDTGTFRIGDGTYDRAPLYTLMVAGLLWLGDGSPAVVRALSMVAGAGLAAALFVWVRGVAGPLAAWIAAAFAILWPEGIFLSQYVRFYTLQGLLFFAGAVAVYHATDPGRAGASRAWLSAGAVAAFGLAVHFTPLTAVGLVPLAAWAGIALILPALFALRGGAWIVAALVLGGLAAAAALWVLGPLREAWEMFRFTPDWAARRQDNLTYYHAMFRDAYPSLWPLTPVAALVAIAHRPRAGLFVTVMALGILGLQSAGGMKAERYVYYGMAFLFALWAIAGAAVAAPAARWLIGIAHRAAGTVLPGRWASAVAWGAVGLAAILVLASNRVLDHVVEIVRRGPPAELGMDWPAAAGPLAPALERADVLVTSKELQAFYHLGRADVILSASRLSELPERDPFSLDPRTGRPVVGDAASVARLMACTADGVILMPAAHVATMESFLTEVPAGTRLEPVALPEATALTAVEWTTARAGGDCAVVDAALPGAAGG